MKRLLATLSLLGALGMGMAFGGSAWAADEAAAPAATATEAAASAAAPATEAPAAAQTQKEERIRKKVWLVYGGVIAITLILALLLRGLIH